jgi:hypothetical protein
MQGGFWKTAGKHQGQVYIFHKKIFFSIRLTILLNFWSLLLLRAIRRDAWLTPDGPTPKRNPISVSLIPL